MRADERIRKKKCTVPLKTSVHEMRFYWNLEGVMKRWERDSETSGTGDTGTAAS